MCVQPLIIGAETGQAGVVELLLHSGASLHLVDASSRSALEIALVNGHLGLAGPLLERSLNTAFLGWLCLKSYAALGSDAVHTKLLTAVLTARQTC